MVKKYYYKAMDKDMKCRGFQFKVGETYTTENEELEICSNNVFYFFEKLEDTIESYCYLKDRHFIIEVFGDIESNGEILFSKNIRVVKEISRDEIEEHIQDKKSHNAKRFLAIYSNNLELLNSLCKEKSRYVRYGVARNINTPAYILEELSNDKEWTILSAVATNSNTTVHILEKLSKNNNRDVRGAVAYNSNTPVYLLKELAKDISWVVREVVVENINTPVHILKELAKDESPDVSQKAQARLKEITQ